jgi:hypothetical protein
VFGDGAIHLPNNQWLILLLFGYYVFSLAIFLLIENALEGKIWLIKYGLATTFVFWLR